MISCARDIPVSEFRVGRYVTRNSGESTNDTRARARTHTSCRKWLTALSVNPKEVSTGRARRQREESRCYRADADVHKDTRGLRATLSFICTSETSRKTSEGVESFPLANPTRAVIPSKRVRAPPREELRSWEGKHLSIKDTSYPVASAMIANGLTVREKGECNHLLSPRFWRAI